MTTIYVAAPIARRDDREIITTDAVKCESAEAAMEHAQRMSLDDGYIGAFALSAISDQASGFTVADVLGRFGSLT